MMRGAVGQPARRPFSYLRKSTDMSDISLSNNSGLGWEETNEPGNTTLSHTELTALIAAAPFLVGADA
jgi:hypothetical protein